MSVQINVSDIVALIALGLSAFSMKKTVDFNKRQNEFIETNDKLNKLLLNKENQSLLNQTKADISANFISIGKNKHRLKIFNKGQNTAKNIRIEILEGEEILLKDDIEEKFPIQKLEQHHNVEIMALVYKPSPRKAKVKLVWDDDFGKNNEKILVPYI